jgi:hypothetical protein
MHSLLNICKKTYFWMKFYPIIPSTTLVLKYIFKFSNTMTSIIIITHCGFCDRFKKWLLLLLIMFITTWSQKLLCRCIMVLWLYSIYVQFLGKYSVFKFLLIYLNDLKFKNKKYHFLLIVTNNDSIFNDDDVACHVLTRYYN